MGTDFPTDECSINHRELTYKAVAGLAGGAIGWLPVEIASHGHNLTDAMSTADIIASYVTMAILSGMIGGPYPRLR